MDDVLSNLQQMLKNKLYILHVDHLIYISIYLFINFHICKLNNKKINCDKNSDELELKNL